MTLDEFCDRARDAETPRDLWLMALEFVQSRGVEMVSYHHHGVIPFFGEALRPEDEAAGTLLRSPSDTMHIVTHGFPREWVDHYVDDKLWVIDPIPELANRVSDPFFWADTGEIAKLVGMQSDYLDELLKSGLGEGLAVQAFGPAGRDGYFGLGFGDTRPDMTQHDIRMMQCALQMTHLIYCSMIMARIEEPPALSPREREVLEWIARGKSNSVIADILGLSAHTVDTIVRRIFGKLEVSDRTTAAIKGVGAGLIQPAADRAA